MAACQTLANKRTAEPGLDALERQYGASKALAKAHASDAGTLVILSCENCMPAHSKDLIDQLRAEAARMAGLVQQSVADAADAIVRGDERLAQSLIAADDRIDSAEVHIEKKAIDLLSLHQPAAGEFRLVLMVIKVNNELERIADCATNIAERVGPLKAELEASGDAYLLPPELVELARSVVELVRQTVRTFNFPDMESAEAVMALYPSGLNWAE